MEGDRVERRDKNGRGRETQGTERDRPRNGQVESEGK
jgi:hypothetical protein